jgi:hypothetical protein
MPEANEISGLAVQLAFVRLPEVYRRVLMAEYCYRPWLLPVNVEQAAARKARLSIGSYEVTLTRALLALVNVMKRRGSWREAINVSPS